ncbi:Unconventional myosin-XIX [Balamuthia mandrillaris]
MSGSEDHPSDSSGSSTAVTATHQTTHHDAYSKGSKVWIPDKTDGFKAAEIVRVCDEAATKFVVLAEEDGEEHTVPKEQIFLRNPSILEGCDDLTCLSYMHEPAILHNLSIRYGVQQIYTFSGPILIAVNPYQKLPIYNKQMMSLYCGQPLGKLSPHVYAIAEAAFREMITQRQSQSILVSGESGAGKTETTKFLLQYFAAMGEDNSVHGDVHHQVLESTPLLEAFGNAKTLRNDNSSRFGKFIKIQFDPSGNISGAAIQTYLLEKSRIVRQQTGERNYHIFYQLVAGATEEQRQRWNLPDATELHYLSQSGCIEVDDVDDAEQLQKTKHAMSVVGLSEQKQDDVLAFLAAILHLGNITFDEKGEGSVITDRTALETFAAIVKCDPNAIEKTLTTRKMVAGREEYTVPIKKSDAEGARDALAMLLYSRLFDWLVLTLNVNIQKKNEKKKQRQEKEVFIGVLDIYGFESFQDNSFEQFCINWSNEKLQQQFNQHIFKLEQTVYTKEELDWSYIEFNDNQPCLDLIEEKPLGLLYILDEESRFPKATPKSLVMKMTKNANKNAYFSLPRFSETAFTIKHYAGSVTYDTSSFIEKNKDFIIPEQVAIMEASASAFVKDLFKTLKQAPGAANKAGPSSSNFKFVSVASQFKQSLNELMQTITATNPHYVRCIKPNPEKQSFLFEKPQVLHQLRCGGVLESVRISVAGYPSRRSYEDFFHRYQILAPFVPKQENIIAACKELVKELGLQPGRFQFGKTMFFLKAGEIGELERRRTDKLNAAATVIQKNWRRWRVQRIYLKTIRAVITLQKFARLISAKNQLQSLRETAATLKIQKSLRMHHERKRFARLRSAAILLQKQWRGVLGRRRAKAVRHEQAALVLQKHYRRYRQQREYLARLRGIVTAQKLWRGKLARRVYRDLRIEARQLSTVVAAKEKLQTKVEELEWRLAAETKERHRERAMAEKQMQELKAKEEERLEQQQENASKAIDEALRKERTKYEQRIKQSQQNYLQEINELKLQLEREEMENKVLKENEEVQKQRFEKKEQEWKEEKDRMQERMEALDKEKQVMKEEIEQLKVQLEKERKEKMDLERLSPVLRRRSPTMSPSPVASPLTRRPQKRDGERDKSKLHPVTLEKRKETAEVPKMAKEKEEEAERIAHEVEQKAKKKQLQQQKAQEEEQRSQRERELELERQHIAEENEQMMTLVPNPVEMLLTSDQILRTRARSLSSEEKEAELQQQQQKEGDNKKHKQNLPQKRERVHLDEDEEEEAMSGAKKLIRFLIFEQNHSDANTQEDGEENGKMGSFCNGVPVPALALFSFLSHWGLLGNGESQQRKEGKRADSIRDMKQQLQMRSTSSLAKDDEKTAEMKKEETSTMLKVVKHKLLEHIVECMKKVVMENKSNDDGLVFWLANISVLLHLLRQKKKAHKQQGKNKARIEEDEEDEEVGKVLVEIEDVEHVREEDLAKWLLSSSPSPRGSKQQHSSASSDGCAYLVEQLAFLLKAIYTLLLKRGCNFLHERVLNAFFGTDKPRSATSSPSLPSTASASASINKRADEKESQLEDTAKKENVASAKENGVKVVGSESGATRTKHDYIHEITEYLSQTLQRFIENFVYLALAQKFIGQLYYYINATVFNELLLCRQYCTLDKGVEIQMTIADLEHWSREEGFFPCFFLFLFFFFCFFLLPSSFSFCSFSVIVSYSLLLLSSLLTFFKPPKVEFGPFKRWSNWRGCDRFHVCCSSTKTWFYPRRNCGTRSSPCSTACRSSRCSPCTFPPTWRSPSAYPC